MRPKPRPASGGEFTPAAALLAGVVAPSPDSQVLLIGGGDGALAVALARRVPEGGLWLIHTDYRALLAAEGALASAAAGNARVCADPTVAPPAGAFDTVAVETPKDRKLARRWLVGAHAALKPGGRLYLAGANDQGIRAVIEDAGALFGNVAPLGYRRRNRVAGAVRPPVAPDPPGAPPWAREPGIAPGAWHEFGLEARGSSFRLRSLPGIFSYDRLDDGTALLLAHLDVPRRARVLDVGCGYGIVGLVAARLGAARVDLIDVNLLAVAAARENIAANGVAGARAFPSDLFGTVGGERYDLIVSNPPFHTGKAVSYDVAHALIDRAPDFLAPGGKLVVVANRFIRYDQRMRARYKEVTCLAETGRYHVLAAT